jgi:hypothetical protein
MISVMPTPCSVFHYSLAVDADSIPGFPCMCFTYILVAGLSGQYEKVPSKKFFRDIHLFAGKPFGLRTRLSEILRLLSIFLLFSQKFNNRWVRQLGIITSIWISMTKDFAHHRTQ